ncbi:hypothetical protein JYU14_04110 [Simkania negevensis]|uniref:Competence protein CoiA nuclease-like domain-containing protein n=1 Tax=Simkania negevensis TaxID=83561 RepID=A0ABS3AR95_9BACT|nr:hypothetical protein [Simkania negevensis]
MQLFAYSQTNSLTSAHKAIKGQDYRCMECGEVLRARSGALLRAHFYHLTHNRLCRQSNKSATHIEVQHYFLQQLGKESCSLEKRFPSIQRIADVVWEKKKIVFEIQCSSITAEEVQQRIADYHSLGYCTIWILHTKRFNKERITAAERFLKHASLFYYTNITPHNQGSVYDQYDLVHKGKRYNRSVSFPITLSSPKSCLQEEKQLSLLPIFLQRRAESNDLFFEGDLIDSLFKIEETKSPLPSTLEAIFDIERNGSTRDQKGVLRRGARRVKRLYLLTLQILLERLCR